MSVAIAHPSLRPVQPDDEPFLRRVYAGVRAEELNPLPWSADQKELFLQQQFDAQDVHYRNYPDASLDVIEVDGESVGRLYIARWSDEIRIMDIALVPEHRNRGIGTTLLRELLDEAAASGKRLSIHVEKFNPARRLYERLGFLPVSEQGLYVLMEVTPGKRKGQT